MSISKSYNKKTGVHYAYETSYEWSEELQKKVQRRRCIGQFDPVTGEIIPNGKVGRPSVKAQPKSTQLAENSSDITSVMADKKLLSNRLKKVEEKYCKNCQEWDCEDCWAMIDGEREDDGT